MTRNVFAPASVTGALAVMMSLRVFAAVPPVEPLEIGTRPQLFVDDYLVDNRWALNKDDVAIADGVGSVLRTMHTPSKIPGPVLVDPDSVPSYPALRYDAEARLFRLWFQANIPTRIGGNNNKGALMGQRHVRYAESKDGLNWTLPNLGLFEYRGNKNNSISFMRPGTFEQDNARFGVSSIQFLNEADMPAADRRGYKYLMTYTLRGGGNEPEDKTQTYLIGTKDGTRWDREHQASILTGSISDGWFGFLYDPERKKYVGYQRPRDRYQGGPYKSPGDTDFVRNEALYAGVVRRIARTERENLWSQEESWARAIFQPDEIDARNHVSAHMSMTAKWYGGVYFGFLIPYVPRERLWTELVISRDGEAFDRTHHVLVRTGEGSDWDSQQAWAMRDWVEVGDEWWFPYFGANASPNTVVQKDTIWGVGIAKIRKEGFVSLTTPAKGGVIVTRWLKWPGGDLLVNCDASQGEMRVRVSDKGRHAYDGFNYAECVPFSGNSVAQKVSWKNGSLDKLKGKEIRLEFYFSQTADLYSFRATGTKQ